MAARVEAEDGSHDNSDSEFHPQQQHSVEVWVGVAWYEWVWLGLDCYHIRLVTLCDM